MEVSKEKIRCALKLVRKAGTNPYVIGGILGASVFAVDQIFKSSVEMQDDTNFPHDAAVENGPDNIEFDKKHNPGICGGAIGSKPVVATAVNAGGMVAAGMSLALRRKEDKVGKVADMVVIGGAASNLYDRVKRGYVVDYLHVKKGPLSKIVFNIADAAIAAGALIGSATRTVLEVKEQRALEAKEYRAQDHVQIAEKTGSTEG